MLDWSSRRGCKLPALAPRVKLTLGGTVAKVSNDPGKIRPVVAKVAIEVEYRRAAP